MDFAKIALISRTFEPDAAGIEHPTESSATRYANVESVWQSEHTEAAQKGFTAEACLSVWPFEYGGEKIAEYDARRLEIYRTFLNKKTGRLELYLGQRVAGYEQ